MGPGWAGLAARGLVVWPPRDSPILDSQGLDLLSDQLVSFGGIRNLSSIIALSSMTITSVLPASVPTTTILTRRLDATSTLMIRSDDQFAATAARLSGWSGE